MDASTFSRLSVGLLLVSVIFLSYFYNFDKFLILSIVILVTNDLRNIIIKKNYLLILLVLTLITFIIFIFSSYEQLKFICFLEIFIIFTIFLSDKYKRELFTISVYLFCIILFYLISIDRILFYTIIFLSFLNDTIAYISGRLIGGPKIMPKISPNKTWSGTLISFFISFIFLIIIDFNVFLSIIVAISLFSR